MFTQQQQRNAQVTGGLAVFTAALLAAPVSAATVAHWDFNEGAGQSVANTQGSPTLTLQLGANDDAGGDANDPTWATGYAGHAIQGEFATTQLTYARHTADWTSADQAALAPAGSYTIELIVSPDNLVTGGTFGSRAMGLLSYRDNANSKIQYLLRLYGGANNSETLVGVFSQFNDDTQADLAFNTNATNDGDQFLITAGNWYYIAATFNDATDTMQLVVRDLATGDEASRSLAWKPMFGLDATPDVLFLVGAESASGRSFDGRIDALRISNDVVAEQDRLYLVIPEPATAGLIGAGVLMLARPRR